jgi:hypothetical protein
VAGIRPGTGRGVESEEEAVEEAELEHGHRDEGQAGEERRQA